MSIPFHPDLMTPAERLDEIAEILAAGILRGPQKAARRATEETGFDWTSRPTEACMLTGRDGEKSR